MTEPHRPKVRVLHAARAGSRRMDPSFLWSLPRVGAPEPSPDGETVCVPVTEYAGERGAVRTALWSVPVRGGSPRRLTSPERHAADPAFAPDGTRLAFVHRPFVASGEKPAPPQVAILALDGGEAETVTDLPLGAFDPQWLPDGSGLVFGVWLLDGHPTPDATREEADRRRRDGRTVHATEERFYRYWDRWLVDGRIPHLFLLDLASRESRDLMPASALHFDGMEPSGSYDIAPDGRRILFTAIANLGADGRPRRDVYRLGFDAPEPERLTAALPHDAFGARHAPDGRSYVFGRKVDADFYADRTRLMRGDPETGAHEGLLEDQDLSPEGWRFVGSGALVFHAESEGTQRLYRLRIGPGGAEGVPKPLTEGGTFARPRPVSGGSVVALHHSLAEPPEVARIDLGSGRTEALTDFARRRMGDVHLGEVREVRYEGAGGQAVQMIVLLPPGHRDGDRPPLVHLVHGGPHGTFGDAWHWRWHAPTFAARGSVVACVNFQGSTSFGQDFARRIQGAWGDRPAGDVHRATDALTDLGWVDAERVAVAGGSYGGYLAAWLASTSDRFCCAVNHAGVYDLGLQLAADVNFGWRRAVGGDLWDDPEAVDRYNPARHAAGLATPMLVIHGERDYRVPVDHALLCYGILKARGIPARLLYFADENHWILDKRSSLRWYAEVLAWLDRFLLA